jgi:hypothetical protein
MAGELHQLSVAIGKLQEGQDRLTQDFRDMQERSTEEHRKVHDIVVAASEAIRNVARDVAEMKPKVAAIPALEIKVAEMEPLTDDYREKRAEKRGADRIARLLLVTFGGIAGALAAKLLDYFTLRPPH